MHVNALRLRVPTANEEVDQVDPRRRQLATAASDVARAIDAALRFQGRFQAFMISGDYQQKMLNMSKANLLLNWQPRHKWADLSAESK